MSNNGFRFKETVEGAVQLLEEQSGDAGPEGPWNVRAIGITADVLNANKRLYPAAILKAAVEEAQGKLGGSLGQGRLVQIMGEAEHPGTRSFLGGANIAQTIINWTGIRFDDSTKQVLLEGKLLGTQQGKDMRAIMRGGVVPNISQRARGKSKQVDEDDSPFGEPYEEIKELSITGYDLVANGADPNATVIFVEHKEDQEEETPMGKPKQEGDQEPGKVSAGTEAILSLDIETLEAQFPHLVESIKGTHEEEIREAWQKRVDLEQAEAEHNQEVIQEREAALREAMGLSDTDDLKDAIEEAQARLQQFEEEQQAQAVAEYIEKEVGGLKYPAKFRETLATGVKAAEPANIEEARELIVARRKEYDAIFAEVELAAMGHPDGVRVLGPVLERDLGVPEFARPSWELTESMRRAGKAQSWDYQKPEGPNQLFAARYMNLYDKRFKANLIQEARMFQEAEQTSDLNLPYTVMRTVVEAAFPTLIATGIFDVDLTDTADVRVFYEDYSGETGEEVSITDEAVTSDEDAWVDMAQKHILPGTVVVEPDGGGTAYTEGTDYAIDYLNGRFFTILAAAGGTIGDATALDVDYDYKAYRKGEMATIERGKGTLSTKTIAVEADRLATQISDEAIKFSRSQLGWDAVQRTIAMLVKQVARRIDAGLMYLALASAQTLASNSGGSWVQANDTHDELVEFLGVAKVLVANRYYEPTAILSSVTNSDILSNWDGFSSAGSRADALLEGNGFVGRVKGLPVFESTEFSDSYFLVMNREIVAYRIFSPMELKGPYPAFSSDQLVSADEYFVEAYSAAVSPLAEKAATVAIS